MHGIEQEGADACSKHPEVTVSNRRVFFGEFTCSPPTDPVPSQDCWPVRRLYPAVHMQALVVGEVGRHSWEQSPLLLLQRLVPGNADNTDKIKIQEAGTAADNHKRAPRGNRKQAAAPFCTVSL